MNDNRSNGTTNGKSLIDLQVMMGTHYVNALRELALKPEAPVSLKQDWQTLSAWLGCSAQALSHDDQEKIGKAFCAYIARGIAPSITLQPSFDKMAVDIKRETKGFCLESPPANVIDVFDRMMAPESEIKKKRESDIARDRVTLETKPAKALGKGSPKQNQTWLQRLSRESRAWIYISSVWAVISWSYLMLFDPLQNGWPWSVEDHWKAASIMVLPTAFWLIKKGFDRFVR